MKLSRREWLAAGATVAAALPAWPESISMIQTEAPAPAHARTAHPANLPIRDYLVREARRITGHALADVKAAAGFARLVSRRRQRFLEMMGLGEMLAANDRPPVPYETTGVVKRADYRIEKIHYESLP